MILTNFSQTCQREISLAELMILANISQILHKGNQLGRLDNFVKFSPFSLLHAFLDTSLGIVYNRHQPVKWGCSIAGCRSKVQRGDACMLLCSVWFISLYAWLWIVCFSLAVNHCKQKDVCPGYIEGLLEEVWKGIFCEVQCMCSAFLLFKVLYSFHLKTVLSLMVI